MREDPVRILRAVRFACKLDLDIESRTYAAMEGAVEDLPAARPRGCSRRPSASSAAASPRPA